MRIRIKRSTAMEIWDSQLTPQLSIFGWTYPVTNWNRSCDVWRAVKRYHKDMYRYFRYMCPRGGNRDTCQRHRLMLACRAWLKATIPLLQRGFGVSNCSILSIRISGSSKRRSTRLDYRVQSRLQYSVR